MTQGTAGRWRTLTSGLRCGLTMAVSSTQGKPPLLAISSAPGERKALFRSPALMSADSCPAPAPWFQPLPLPKEAFWSLPAATASVPVHPQWGPAEAHRTWVPSLMSRPHPLTSDDKGSQGQLPRAPGPLCAPLAPVTARGLGQGSYPPVCFWATVCEGGPRGALGVAAAITWQGAQ